MIFESRGITPACPYAFSLTIPFEDRDRIGKDLYEFIGAVLRRKVPVNKTAVVWLRWSECVIWDDADTNEWHTERVYESLVFTDQVTHPGFRMERLGWLKFQTKGWTSGGTDGL